MEENEKTEEEVKTDEFADLVGRLENISKGADTVRLATVASNTEGKKVVVQSVTGEEETKIEEERTASDQLRKHFENIAKASPTLAHFGTTKALEDPVGHLRATYTDIGGRQRYRVSDGELEDAIQLCLSEGRANGKNPAGTPVWEWAGKNNQQSAVAQAFDIGCRKGVFMEEKSLNSSLSKALETGSGSTSGGPLIRVDIEPLLREAYLRKFPLFDMIRKFPANGLVHSYNQRTDPGTAGLVAELGDLSATDSESTYVRKANSNIAVMAARRQISLKLQYAVAQSGMSFDVSGSGNLEVIGALQSIASLDQALICQGNYTTSTGTVSNEDGAYNNLGFDGLRTILKDSSTAIDKASTDSYLRRINQAVADVVNSGGSVDNLVILCSLYAKMDIEDSELLSFLRVMNTTPSGGFPTNLASNGLTTVADTLTRLMPIPANSQSTGIGYYTYSAASVEDMYVVDPAGIGLAYLGSPTPAILELPVGFNNALSNVYVPFVMHGLTVFVTKFNRKIRIPRVTS